MPEVTDATFQRDVIDRSRHVPVVVDLWAPWCGPCRTLTPILESVVAATGGAVELAAVNIDENPQIAAGFQVQSIPAVYAVKDGAVADGFLGAQPEEVVRQFIERLLPAKEESEADRLVAAGDESSLRRALELEPGHETAVVGLAELLIRDGRTEEALEVLERIPETAEVRRVKAAARLGGNGAAAAGVEARLDSLLERVKGDDDARQEFVDLLEVLGPDDPRTSEYRKALTARLF